MALITTVINIRTLVMFKKTVVLPVLLTLPLLGCGGGGDSADNSPPIVKPLPTGADFSQSPVDYSVAALDTFDSMLQLAFMTNNLVSLPKGTVSGLERICLNGGLITSHYDNENPELQAGEQITIAMSDCYRPEIDDSVDGTLAVEVISYDSESGVLSFSTTFDGTSINGFGESMLVTGSMTVSSVTTLEHATLDLAIDNTFDIQVTSDFTLSLGALDIEHVRNKATAKYSLSGNGRLLETDGIDAFDFAINQPFVGYFEEYPHEGKMTLSSPVSSDLVITTNFVTDSALFNYTFEGMEASYNWADALNGALWSSDTSVRSYGYANEHRADNFQSLGIDSIKSGGNIPVFVGTDFYFSRPVARVELELGYLESSDYSVERVEVELEVNGAVVTMTPKQPLQPGTNYTFHGMVAYDQLGQSVSTGYFTFNTSSQAVANINLSHYFSARTDTPTLTIEANFANSGEIREVQWQELSDYGVAFVDQGANTVSLDLTGVAENTNEVVILAEVQSNNGLTAYTSKEVIVLPNSDTLLAIVSEKGDWVGGGRSMSYDENEGVFEIASYSSPNYIHFRFESSLEYDYWTLDFQAPEGQTLEVGLYENATRYPFQLGNAPGMDYSGNHRGCNNLYGEFEIHEIEFEGDIPTKLAVDWVQYCESLDSPPARGVLRYNSSVSVAQ